MSDGQTPGNADTPSGLRRAMEDRLTSLRQADDLSRARAGTAATNIFSWQ